MEGNKRVGIVGFGEMGKRHGKDMEAWSKGLINISGVYEPDDLRYSQGCEWMGRRPDRFLSVEELLKKTSPDGVIISSPNSTHLENLQLLKGMSTAILLEKPLDTSLERICKVTRFAETYPGRIMVHHVMRYAPITVKAKSLIASGAIGKICSFHFTQYDGGGMVHNFRRTMATGGGQLIEKATHDLDILLHLTESLPLKVTAVCKQQCYGGNKPDSLRCSSCMDRISCPSFVSTLNKNLLNEINACDDLCAYAKCVDIPDNETCFIELENDIFGTYSHTFFVHNYYSRVYEIVGTEGIVQILYSDLHSDKHYDGKILLANESGRQEFTFEYYKRIHYNGAPGVVRHFYELMRGREDVLSPVNQAFAAELIGLSAYKSNQLGAAVRPEELIPSNVRKIFKNAYGNKGKTFADGHKTYKKG